MARQHVDAVQIRVEAIADEAHLILRVTNTISAGEAVGRDGIGLKNVRERLAIQFGEQAVFDAVARPGGLWVAEIRMPLLLEVSEPVATPVAA